MKTYNKLGALLLLTTLSACQQQAKPEEQEKAEKKHYCIDKIFKQRIRFDSCTIRPVSEGIPLTGIVESNPDKVISFLSLVNGIIANTYFALGDKVVKGQLLAELRSSELSTLQSEQKTLESQIRVTERKMQSVKSMFEDGIASQKDLLEAESELTITKVQLEKVNSILSLYSASSDRGVFQIKAPASGIITAKNITPGMQISGESAPLFTISDLSEVWVLLNIYAGNVARIEPGLEVEIKTLSYPDQVFRGKIGALSQVFDSEERVMKARVVMKNSEYKLKPGMLTDVTALRHQNTQAIAIPTSALIFDDNHNFVVIYKDDCNLEVRPVEILTKSNGTAFISSGLNENEQVISRNQLLIYEQIKSVHNN